MQAPGAAYIEAAVDSLKETTFLQQHANILAEQDKQVRAAVPGREDSFYSGFALGMMTARVLLCTMPNAVLHKVEL